MLCFQIITEEAPVEGEVNNISTKVMVMVAVIITMRLQLVGVVVSSAIRTAIIIEEPISPSVQKFSSL